MDNRDMLNSLLCDELLGEILGRLQEINDCKNTSLVCRRWLAIQRRVKTSLGLRIPEGTSISCFGSPVRLLLRQYSHISSLYVVSDQSHIDDTVFSDYVLDAIGEGCKFLKELRLEVGPVSSHGLKALARGSTQLTSLELVGLRSKYLSSLAEFKSLTELSLVLFGCNPEEDFEESPNIAILPLEKLCLAGVWAGYQGLGWIWRNCPKLQKLEFCEGIGDLDSPSFAESLSGLQELHLRKCRTIANGVLIRVAENCKGLRKLVFYDGGNTEGLHHVVRQCKNLEVLDLRLPLDLSNEDLAVIAENCMSLRSLRLHSCWLATGAGIKLLGHNMKICLEELVLVRCRAIVQEPGTLTTLGQHLKCLKRLDLSDNDHIPVKELGVMLASCKSLLNLRLFRCRGLTDMVVMAIVERCSLIESIDIRKCDGITAEAVSALVLGCPKLRQLGVEDHKITEATWKLASRKKVSIIKAEIPVSKRTIRGMKHFFDDFSSLDPIACLL